MNKQRGLIMVSIFAIAAGSAFAVQDRQITIESSGKRVYKKVDHEGRVRLVRQLSDKPCREGRSWGYDRSGIWVDDGCRAVFSYQRDNGRPDWSKPTPGTGVQRFKLESDGGRESRRIDTSGGVRLSKRLSDKECTLGRSWGFDRNSVWVDRGCRAEFEVGRGSGGGLDPWLPGGGVPNWAIGEWRGGTNSNRDYTLVVSKDGSAFLRRGRSSGERGSIRGERVRIGNDEFRLERRGNNGIRFVPVSSRAGQFDFSRS